MSRAERIAVAALVALTARTAEAGDTCPNPADVANCRPAHETATAVTAQQVMQSYLPLGLGQSSEPALVNPPMFVYGNAGVAQPDDWPCYGQDSVLPIALSNANHLIVGSSLAFAAKLKGGGANLVCNFTHFSQNPAFPGHDALSTEQLVRSWADRITSDIQSSPGRYNTGHFCDAATFSIYQQRENDANHFLEDNTTVFHRIGNQVCSPQFSASSSAAKSCVQWLLGEEALMENNSLPCDGEVSQQLFCATVDTDGGPVEVCQKTQFTGSTLQTRFSDNAQQLIDSCRSANLLLLIPGGPMGACAGLERLMRHHCPLNYSALQCKGPGDQSVGHTYCEGEINRDASGNDWMPGAEQSVLQPITTAAAAWATVCKQPDFPCDPTACQTWCERSLRIQDIAFFGGTQPFGYCYRASGDSSCQAPHCECGTERDITEPSQICGVAGGPCCKTQFQDNGGCTADNVCDPSEGLCEPCGRAGQRCCSTTASPCDPGLGCTASTTVCHMATCQPPPPPLDAGAPDGCTPMTCANFVNPDPAFRKCVPNSNPCIPIPGASCGNPPDGCGGTLKCGSCADAGGFECNREFNCDHACTSVCPVCSDTPVTVTDSCGNPHVCQVIPCPGGERCVNGMCCQTCATLGLSCGTADDGCGNVLNCGPPCCTPNCLGRDCGSNGCGGSCGTCVDPDTCGGGGTDGQCGCNASFSCIVGTCGTVVDRCGVSHECQCPAGTKCQSDGSCCTPQCAGKQCGDDGCGGVCGTCAAPNTCGGNGTPNTCGCSAAFSCFVGGCREALDGCGVPHECKCPNASDKCQADGTCCTPSTNCTDKCGPQPDGCGGTLECEPCCTPTTCAALGDVCGEQSDGCNGSLSCSCANAGDVCNAGSCCTPLGCEGQCGTVGDGCGGEIDCGACCTPSGCEGLCGEVDDGCGDVIDCGSCGGGGGGGCDPEFECCVDEFGRFIGIECGF
ncbi:MAG TPA: hypothetical protein VFF06_10625 [Polyangia bacterium]|nr:hypothetical protein [Polyangia bacterium]